AVSFGGESGLRKLGLGGTHPLTRRYVIGGNIMKNAEELGFETAITYSVISNHTPGKPIEYSGINTGDSVTLQYDSERITVTSVKEIAAKTYQGKISGFDPSISVAFKSLKLGDEIEFNEHHVFSCTRV
ncbi:hypothetical protein ACM6U7_004394, partial [Vibrio vulnificus]